jgi:hypothetical protein
MEIHIADKYILRGDRNSWDLYRLAVVKDADKPENNGKIREVSLGYHGTIDNALQALITKHLGASEVTVDVHAALVAIQKSVQELRTWVAGITHTISPKFKADPPDAALELP